MAKTVTIAASEYKALLRDKALLDFLQAEADKARPDERGVVAIAMRPGWGPRRDASSYVRVVLGGGGLQPTCTSSTDIRYLLAKAHKEAESGEA